MLAACGWLALSAAVHAAASPASFAGLSGKAAIDAAAPNAGALQDQFDMAFDVAAGMAVNDEDCIDPPVARRDNSALPLLARMDAALNGGAEAVSEAADAPSPAPAPTSTIVQPAAIAATPPPLTLAPAPVMQPMAATAATPTTWEIQLSDKTLNAALSRWATAAGWQVLWELPVDYAVQARTVVPGTFEEAVTQVVKSMATAEIPLKATFYRGNKVLRITARGGQ